MDPHWLRCRTFMAAMAKTLTLKNLPESLSPPFPTQCCRQVLPKQPQQWGDRLPAVQSWGGPCLGGRGVGSLQGPPRQPCAL